MRLETADFAARHGREPVRSWIDDCGWRKALPNRSAFCEHHIMTGVAIAILSGGLVMFLICLPLIYRKIPMNHIYGIRIAAAFESEQRWYEINAYGGRRMAAWSWVIIATGTLGFFVPREHFLIYAWASVAVSLGAVLIPTVQIIRWSRKHDEPLVQRTRAG